jgi:hypothetical protein
MVVATTFDYLYGKPTISEEDYCDVMQLIEINKEDVHRVHGSGCELERASDRVYSWWKQSRIIRTIVITEMK